MSFQVFKTDDTFLILTDPVSGKLRHIPTKITYAYDFESDSIDVDFGSAEENQAYIDRFSRGELVNVCLKVSAQALGETGTDYLGACHEIAQTMESGMLSTAIEHDMKNQACIELKGNILLQYKMLVEAIEERKIS
jgi:hypothetical protein